MCHSEEPKASSTISSWWTRVPWALQVSWQLQSTLCWKGRAAVLALLRCLTATSGPAAKGLPARALLRGLWTNRNKEQGAVGVECPHTSLSQKIKPLVCIIRVLETWSLQLLDKGIFLQIWTEALVSPQPLDCTKIQLPQPSSLPGGQNCSLTLMSIWSRSHLERKYQRITDK